MVLDRPVVTLDLHQPADEYADGMMGLRLLRLLDLAVDPGRDDLWIRRNGVAPLPDTGRYALL